MSNTHDSRESRVEERGLFESPTDPESLHDTDPSFELPIKIEPTPAGDSAAIDKVFSTGSPVREALEEAMVSDENQTVQLPEQFTEHTENNSGVGFQAFQPTPREFWSDDGNGLEQLPPYGKRNGRRR